MLLLLLFYSYLAILQLYGSLPHERFDWLVTD